MRVSRVTANLRVGDLESGKGFYTDFLGLATEEFSLGWVARYTSPESGASLQLLTQDATAPEPPVASLHVDDVDAAFEEAQRHGYEIVHPLTTEPWGVRRFLVRAPDGNVLNLVQHRE
jgi:predicted enzyme related to lactoylglutathione lyase